MIQCLRDHQVDATIEVKLDDSATDTYKYTPTTALLATWEKINKDKHVKHHHDQRKHSLPFVLSLDRMLGREALAVLYKLS